MKLKFELTLSTLLSLLRLVLAPFVLVFILTEYNIPALVLFIIAAITDALDGYIARKTKKITKFGSAIDAFADKVLIGLTMIGLAVKFSFPIWALIIFLARDLFLITASLMIYEAIPKFKATQISKVNTWFQVGSIVGYVIDFRYKNLILLIAVILTIISFLQYLSKLIKKK